MDPAHQDARQEARRLIGRLVHLLEEGEHLGTPHRADHRIVIPIEGTPQETGPDAASMRALLAAWLDAPPHPK